MADFYFKTEKLSVGYNGKPLIKDINIELKRGEILTLIGPNGAGKSTILKSISSHLKTIAGTVMIDKSMLSSMSYKEISTKMAVVLTERMKPELMTCRDVVASGRYPYTGRLGFLTEEDNKIIDDAMEMTNSSEIANRDFTAISDGQRQRIMLARAICQQPEIIILDEPTSFLDIKHKLELLDILRKMAKENDIVVILSLHEIDLAQKISDNIMCVKGEYIVKYGSPEEIFVGDSIKELYDIQKGEYNIYFGSVELPRPEGEAKTFVIAGNGSGINTFRELQKSRIPFYCGILGENDIDYQLSKSLAKETVSEKAFAVFGNEAYEKALNLLKKCNKVICTCKEFGVVNAINQKLLDSAKSLGLDIEYR